MHVTRAVRAILCAGALAAATTAVPGGTLAQGVDPTARPQFPNTSTTDDTGFGWIGLLGLVGVLGLFGRRKTTEREHDFAGGRSATARR